MLNNLFVNNGGLNRAIFIFFIVVLIMNLMNGFITLVLLFSLVSFIALGLNKGFDRYAGLILLYSLSYGIIMSLKGGYDLSSCLLDVVVPCVFYLYGKYLLKACKEESIISVIILIVIAFGASVYYFTIKGIIESGALIMSVRSIQLFGNEGYELGATGIGSCVCMGFFGLASVFIVDSKKQKFILATIFIFSLLTTVSMINRTGLFISVISLIITLFVYFKGSMKHLFWVLCCFVGIWVLISKLGWLDGDVLMAYQARELDEDASIRSGGARTNRWLYALSMIPSSPFGWRDVQYNYIHNMWLDVAKNAGWIPFFFLVVLTIKEIRTMVNLLKIDRGSLSCILLTLIICMLLDLMVEPITGGSIFAMLCLWWGMQNQHYQIIITQK